MPEIVRFHEVGGPEVLRFLQTQRAMGLSAVPTRTHRWRLVFRQTEINAAIEDALAEVLDPGRKAGGHRIIKLP